MGLRTALPVQRPSARPAPALARLLQFAQATYRFGRTSPGFSRQQRREELQLARSLRNPHRSWKYAELGLRMTLPPNDAVGRPVTLDSIETELVNSLSRATQVTLRTVR